MSGLDHYVPLLSFGFVNVDFWTRMHPKLLFTCKNSFILAPIARFYFATFYKSAFIMDSKNPRNRRTRVRNSEFSVKIIHEVIIYTLALKRNCFPSLKVFCF